MTHATTPYLTPAARRTLRSLAPCIAPDVTSLDDAGWTELFAAIDHALALRPARQRRQLLLFLRLIEIAALLRWATPLARLAAARRARLLASLQDAPLLLVRRGFWGVRTLVLMGYYTQRAAAESIGYHASALGWDAAT